MAIFTSRLKFTDEWERAKHKIARNVSLFSFVVFGVVCYLMKEDQVEANVFYYYLFTCVMTGATGVLLFFSKYHHIAYYGMGLGGSAIIQMAANTGDHSLHYSGFMWLIISILFCYIGTVKIFTFSLLLLNAIGILWFANNYFDENLIFLQYEVQHFSLVIGFEVVSILFIGIYLMYEYVSYMNTAQKHLKELNQELEKRNELISNQNEEKTVLVKEIHHRIKNNLQIIISLLRMQREEMATKEAQDSFSEAINRIMTMSLIHQKLYKEEELSKIDLKSYIQELVEDLISVSLWRDKVHLEVESNIEHMGLDMVVPLGLLINELVSNSLKYAFIENDGGEIKIRINQSGGSYGFAYYDNGIWKEPKEKGAGFGTELIDILTEQLNGTKKFNIENGTSYNFTLKEPTHA
ncbi:MAG: sensor histidine kinase [Crocinitomicaceae bacterium]